MVKGMILVSEAVPNSKRRFGAANNYVPVWIRDEYGNWGEGLLTRHDLANALERGVANPEDLTAAFGNERHPDVE